MYTALHSSENTSQDIDEAHSQSEFAKSATRVAKSATTAATHEAHSHPGITKADMSVTRNLNKQATKYTDQFSEANKYTEQQSPSLRISTVHLHHL